MKRGIHGGTATFKAHCERKVTSFLITCAFLTMLFWGAGVYAGSALVGVDFGPDQQSSPMNWTSVSRTGNYDALINENGHAADIGLEVVLLSGSILTASNAEAGMSTIPSHGSSLTHISGNIYSLEGGTELNLLFYGLDGGRDYNVWLFGLRAGSAYTQKVEIIGSEGSDNFSQSGGDRELTVNESIGSSSRNLSSYARIYRPSTNGEISLRVTPGNGYFLAGVAIQQRDTDDTECFVSISSQ